MDYQNKQCARCGTVNPFAATFCSACGSSDFVCLQGADDGSAAQGQNYYYEQPAQQNYQQSYDQGYQQNYQQSYDQSYQQNYQQSYDQSYQQNYQQGYDQAAYQQPAQAYAPPAAAKQKGKNGKKFILIGVAVFVVLILAVALFGGSSDGPSTDVPAGNYTDIGTTAAAGTDEPSANGNSAISDAVAGTGKTIMIYIVGSDLESDYGSASEDIVEMLDSGVDTATNNILIYTGGTSYWYIPDIPTDANTIYRLVGDEFIEEKSFGSLSMGASSTLAEFVKYGLTTYPADSYGLILWNHGAGPLIGYGLDEVHNDILEMSEITSALSSAGLGSSQKLEFLGFDACLMGSVETAWVFKDYAEYLIASQETEPGTGWDYSFLNCLNSCNSGSEIAKEIIDRYFTAYDKLVAEYPQLEADLTLSCLDLSEIYAVEEDINNLFGKVDTNILSGSFQKTSRYRFQTKAFGKFTADFEYDLIDLEHITSLLSSEYKTECDELKSSLDKFVVYSKSNVENAGGVSIYHPYDNKDYMNSWTSTYNSFGFAPQYSNYIADFGKLLTSDAPDVWKGFNKAITASKKDADGKELTIQLTEEQAANYVSSTYFVLKEMEEDEYLFIFCGRDAELDANGVLSASYNDKAVFGVDDSTGEVAELPVIMYQISDGSDELKYLAPAMFIDCSSDDITQWRYDPVEWQVKIENGTPRLLGAMLMDDGEIPAKQLVNYTDYSHIQFAFSARKITYDESGVLLPYLQWESTGMFYGTEFSVEDGFHLECRDIEEKDEYFAMFVIKDSQGNQYASELFSLAK